MPQIKQAPSSKHKTANKVPITKSQAPNDFVNWNLVIGCHLLIAQAGCFVLRKARRILKVISKLATSPTLFDVHASVAARFIAPALRSRPE
jgi:hypothetical protein